MRESASDSQIGYNSELPEGVFGILDDLTLPTKPGILHEAEWEIEAQASLNKAMIARKKNKKKKRDPSATNISVPDFEINREAYASELPDLEYENTVDVPEALLKSIKRKTRIRTQDLSHILMNRVIPSYLSLEAAQSYVTSALRDGLGVDLEMDESAFEATKALANMEVMYFFLRRSSVPQRYKTQFLTKFIEDLAASTHLRMTDTAKADDSKRNFALLQSLIHRGVSSSQRREDKRRSTRAEDENAEPFFGVDPKQEAKKRSSDIGALRTGRRSVR